ncbi:MAG TPA: phosphoribosyltransferase family protein [Candidatus Saccharimonadales bacterium]|nr:phosphoribosyltransferase family protein [Candidatus Saccharimonadales bacterium]
MSNHTQDQPALYKEIVASPQEVYDKIDELATTIIREFKDKDPLFVCLLRGGMPFATQLMFAIARQDPYFNPELDYITVSRYGNSQIASEPRIVMDLSHKSTTTDRTIIILDDLIDKGGTYLFTKKHLENKGASEVYLAVLVQRELEKPRGFDADFYCISVKSEEWFVGMGMDDTRLGTEAHRWTDYVAIANSPSDL